MSILLCKSRLLYRVRRRIVISSAWSESAQTENKSEKEDSDRSQEYYNSPQSRQYHALLAHPVNKPYHSNKRLVQQVRQMQKLEEAEIESIKQSQFTATGTETTAIQKVEQKTKLQILEEQIQKESELKYYTEDEYKPGFVDFYGVFTNLNVDLEQEAKRHRKWRARLDKGQIMLLSLIGLFSIFILFDAVGRLYYLKLSITQKDKKNIQSLETEVARIQSQVSLGKNWNPNMEKSLRDLAKIKAELELAIKAEEAAAAALSAGVIESQTTSDSEDKNKS